ncbi:Hypothetical protein NTJ_14260 [Nesidiocoris tenuis]|uniref:SRCR domain-containing protein n=1 Tax=Nesidiocoris tenuis TaxID=355587 RepID=A0ABN7BAN9_9HEMI|nr:Hypothetical protein NTJ_14260 [Nesidiocoris tenuis]
MEEEFFCISSLRRLDLHLLRPRTITSGFLLSCEGCWKRLSCGVEDTPVGDPDTSLALGQQSCQPVRSSVVRGRLAGNPVV